MKTLPWILTLAFAIATLVQFFNGQSREIQLAKLRADVQELERERADREGAGNLRVDANEVERLRKEREEVYKLRNQVAQLRKQLSERAVQPVVNEIEQPPLPTDLPAELPAEDPMTRQQREQCIYNLQVIEEAKTMWAVANNKQAGEKATLADITTALPNNSMPLCPAGGVYNLNEVGIPVSCSVATHSLLP